MPNTNRLSQLPSELQVQIYSYVVSSHNLAHKFPETGELEKASTPHSIYWPAILRVSQAICNEAAHVYYTSKPFHFNIMDMDFSQVQDWLAKLPTAHRSLLSRNRNLRIRIWMYTSAVPSELWSSWPSVMNFPMFEHKAICARFFKGYRARGAWIVKQLVFLCRLLTWYEASALAGLGTVAWSYEFPAQCPGTNVETSRERLVESMYHFLRDVKPG